MNTNDGFIDTLLSQKSEGVRVRLLAKYDAESVMKIVCACLNNEEIGRAHV